ncbi:MAG: four helix bundle protein [Candidatus Levybacteria bacterium]|nr:four helix bundle protein [Candidatus Levybacteria bacterium]
MNTYRDLIVWQKTDSFAHLVYKETKLFPKSEIFGLTSQLRRAALSVPTNIVEGYSRLSKNEFRHFLTISYGSLSEAEYLLLFSLEEGLIKKEDYENLISLKDECGRLIWGMYISQKKSA